MLNTPDRLLGSPAANVLLQGALQQADRPGVLPRPARAFEQAAHAQPAPLPGLNICAKPQHDLQQQLLHAFRAIRARSNCNACDSTVPAIERRGVLVDELCHWSSHRPPMQLQVKETFSALPLRLGMLL